MDQQKIESYKKQLEAEKEKILSGIKKEGGEDFGSDVDVDQETDEAESFGEQVAMNQAFKERLAEVDEALRKIASGKYGICEKCGSDIEDEVLNVSIASGLCKNCKKDL